MLILPILVIPVIHGFLLENNHSVIGQTTQPSKYLKISAFLDEKNRLQQATERLSQNTVQLRHDVDTYFAELSSQLQEKFNILEQKLEGVGHLNETQQELALLQEKYVTLEQKYNSMQNSYAQLKRENDLFHVEFQLVKNVSSSTSKELSDLKHLGTIKPLQDISKVQQSVQSLLGKTNALSMKEQARSQDFLALYNMTVASKRSIIELNTQMGTRIEDLENQMNDTLQQKDQVALMSYLPGGDIQMSGILKFSKMKFSVGITNLSTFQATGKFECERSGIYLVSASTVGTTKGANLYIYVNGHKLSNTRISEGYWQTGTVVLVVQLLTNDMLWVQVDSMQLSGDDFSVFSIVKVW